MKYWKVTVHLNYDASNVQSVTIKANTRREAYEDGKTYFYKNGACKVDIENVIALNVTMNELLEIDIQSKTGRICHVHAPVLKLGKEIAKLKGDLTK